MRSRKYLYMAPSLVPHRTALLIVLLLLTCELQSCSAWESHNQGDDEAKALPHRRDLVVRGLEQHVPAFADFDGEMYAGLIPMDNDNPNARGATAANPQRRRGELMFWLFAPRETANPNALTIWLNGGPGCTSFGAGLFLENSPVTVQPRPAGYCCLREDEPLQYNRYAWTNASALLYIEQPVSVGFSRGGPVPANEDELSGDVYAWLLNFYRVFDEYQDSQLFIFGESYAGMYVPSIAHRIHRENQKLAAGVEDGVDRRRVPLEGIALGNGWVDARVQGPATIDYAYWHGLIDAPTRDDLHGVWARCQAKGPAFRSDPPFHPFNVPDDCAMMEGVLRAAGAGALRGADGASYPLAYGPNTYDITTWDPYGVILDGNTTFNLFFNDRRIKEILHAPLDTEWAGCIPGAGRRRRRLSEEPSDPSGSSSTRRRRRNLILENDRPISTVPYIAELLDDAGVRVLVYNGDRDLSTNAQGSETLLNSMDWDGMHRWKRADRALWIVTDPDTSGRVVGGYAKELQGLAFVVVSNSGHMVPFNQPLPALDLIKRFVLNETFMDYTLPRFESQEGKATVPGRDKTVSAHSTSNTFSPLHPMAVFFSLLGAFAVGYWFSAACRKKSDNYQRLSNIEVN